MVLSFAYPGDGSRATFVPSSGISASIYNVDESSRTTLAFTCPSAGARSTAGALCPISSNHPIAVTVGPDYFGWDFYRSYSSDNFAPTTTLASDVRVDGALRCAVTSTKTKASPVCTVDVTDIPSAAPTADIMADMRCWEEDVAGPVANQTQGVYVSAVPRTDGGVESLANRDVSRARTRCPWAAVSLQCRPPRLRSTLSRAIPRT